MEADLTDDWWVAVSGDRLEQGHLLTNIVHPLLTDKQLLALVEPGLKSTVTFQRFSAITVTQSCDFANEKVKRALVVRALNLSDARSDPGFSAEDLQQVRDGRRPLWALLAGPNDPKDKDDCILIDFRLTVSLPITYLRAIARALGKRPALRSPYLEYFSAAFAHCYGRVALPNDLPVFVSRQ